MNMFNPQTARHTAWQRWEMARLDAPARQDAPADDAHTQACTRLHMQAELEHHKYRAQEQGYAQGYAEGHAEGLAQGTRTGHAEGLQLGQEEGLQAGFQAGLQEGQKTVQQHAQHMQQLVQTCAQALDTLEHEVGHALVNLAASIAEHVLHSTLAAHPEKMLDVVRDIVRLHGEHDAALTLRVHPQDYDLVQQYLEHDGALKRWRLLADETLQAGGCQAETALGAVDATLQTRWRKVLGALGIDAMTHPTTHNTALHHAPQDTP